MKRTFIALAALGLWAAAAPTPATAAEKLKVACVLKTLSSQYWKIVAAGAKEAAAKNGVDLTLAGPPSEDDVEQQVNMIQDALTQKPAVLLLAASQPPTVIPVLEKAKKMGIPVVLIDTDVEWPSKATFIGTTNFTAGKQGGEFLVKNLQKGDKVVLIDGAPGNPACNERIKGAAEVLEKAGFKIAANQPAYSDRDKALNVMQNVLQAQPDVKAVFAANDEMALGAARALSQSGKKDVKIVGFDGIADAANAIKSGDMFATVAQQPYDMGRIAVESAVKLAHKGQVAKRIDSGTKLITKDNAQAQLDFLAKIQ